MCPPEAWDTASFFFSSRYVFGGTALRCIDAAKTMREGGGGDESKQRNLTKVERRKKQILGRYLRTYHESCGATGVATCYSIASWTQKLVDSPHGYTGWGVSISRAREKWKKKRNNCIRLPRSESWKRGNDRIRELEEGKWSNSRTGALNCEEDFRGPSCGCIYAFLDSTGLWVIRGKSREIELVLQRGVFGPVDAPLLGKARAKEHLVNRRER